MEPKPLLLFTPHMQLLRMIRYIKFCSLFCDLVIAIYIFRLSELCGHINFLYLKICNTNLSRCQTDSLADIRKLIHLVVLFIYKHMYVHISISISFSAACCKSIKNYFSKLCLFFHSKIILYTSIIYFYKSAFLWQRPCKFKNKPIQYFSSSH